MTECAIFAALLCIVSPLSIPIGTVPVSLGVLGVMLAGLFLGWKQGLVSVLIFLLLGLCGLPVFTGFQSGMTALPGPTGGYIWSYLPMAALIGLLTKRLPSRRVLAALRCVLACFAGLCVCYLCGTFQFTIVTELSFISAAAVCITPFLVFDILKTLLATFLVLSIKPSLHKAGLLIG